MTTSEEQAEIEKMLRKDPLVKFSIYTHIQVDFLRQFAKEICTYLDVSLAKPGVVDKGWHEAYYRFWLWLLGAYEIVRTMSQAASCFTPATSEKLTSLKRKLSKLRVPFAKQEYPGRSLPVRGELSMYGHDFSTRSLTFRVGDEVFSMRALMGEFESVLGGITYDDILRDHRDSHGYPTRTVTGNPQGIELVKPAVRS